MADKVGKLHKHELPHNRDLPVREDVYSCYCGKEFMVEEKTETRFGNDNKKWVEVPGDYAIEYERTVNGQPFIGRAGPDTVFDVEPVDQLAGEASDAGIEGGSGSEVAESSDGTS